MAKPPAFQFYAKDWNSSPTIKSMTLAERGVFITLLSTSWDSQEPGTLPADWRVCSKLASIRTQILRKFASKYTQLWVEIDGKFVNEKLRNQWIKTVQFNEMASDRGKSGASARWKRHDARSIDQALLKHSSASASAVLSFKKKEPKKRSEGSDEHKEKFYDLWGKYRRGNAKQEAFKSFCKIDLSNGTFGLIMYSVEKYNETEQWQDPSKIPYLSTFLNQKRYLDFEEDYHEHIRLESGKKPAGLFDAGRGTTGKTGGIPCRMDVTGKPGSVRGDQDDLHGGDSPDAGRAVPTPVQ